MKCQLTQSIQINWVQEQNVLEQLQHLTDIKLSKYQQVCALYVYVRAMKIKLILIKFAVSAQPADDILPSTSPHRTAPHRLSYFASALSPDTSTSLEVTWDYRKTESTPPTGRCKIFVSWFFITKLVF